MRVGGFPFEINLDIPSKETVEAMLEAERIAKDYEIKVYNAEDALEEFKK